MDFRELSRKVVDLYVEGSYEQALALVDEGRKKFPDEDSALTWFEACLLGVSGEPQRALEVLQAGLDRSLGWHPQMLTDPDLDSVRTLDGWESFETRSAARVEKWAAKRPPPFVRVIPNPAGTVVALHGAGSDPGDFFEAWDSATPEHWNLVIPVGEVPRSTDGWAWSYDLSTDLAHEIGEVELVEPIVLAGFSQGARLAAKSAWDGNVDATGLVLTAAVLTPKLWEESGQRQIPTYVLTGTEDGGYEGCVATTEMLRDHGVPVSLEVREGLGHEPVDDLDQVMTTALAWILSSSE
ncbi:MAG TPA: hypothetical protein VE569_13550 [Acidimicrobiia bacterium]|nr:hypothetical protein [Acidimicrobiia bacterium]